MNLPQLPQDKANHFVYGTVIFTVSLLVVNSVWALGVVVLAAILKELRDMQGFGTPEVADALATIAGGLVCFLCNAI